MLAISKYDAKTRLYQSNYIQLFIWLYNNIENLLSFLKIYKYIKFHFDLIIKNYSFWDKSNTNIGSSDTFYDWRSTTVSKGSIKSMSPCVPRSLADCALPAQHLLDNAPKPVIISDADALLLPLQRGPPLKAKNAATK